MKQSNSTLFANSSSLARNLRVVLSKKKEQVINSSEQVPYGGIIIVFSFGDTKYVKITDGVKTVNLLPKIGVGGEGDVTLQQAINNGDVLTKGLKINNPDNSQVMDIGGKWSGNNEDEESKVFVKDGRIALYSERFANNTIATQLITGSKLGNIKQDFGSTDTIQTDFGFNDNGVLHVKSKVKNAVNSVDTDYEYSFPIKHGTDREVVCWDGNGNMKAMRLGWKQFSDLPSTPTFSNGVLAGTAFQPNGNALFAFIELATEGAKAAAIPLYKSDGRMSVGNATESDDAICLGQINGVLKAIQGYNASGTQTLTHINGTLQWV